MPDETTELEFFFELHAKVEERAADLEKLYNDNIGASYLPMNPLAIADEVVVLRTLNHALQTLYEGHLQVRDMLMQKMAELDKK